MILCGVGKPCEQKSFNLNINIIPGGLYFYKISRKGHNLHSGKLTIIKL